MGSKEALIVVSTRGSFLGTHREPFRTTALEGPEVVDAVSPAANVQIGSTFVDVQARRSARSGHQTIGADAGVAPDRVPASSAVANPGVLPAFVYIRARPSVGHQRESFSAHG